MAANLGTPMQAVVISSLLLTAVYLYRKLYYKRFIQNAHIPQLPPSLLWGHGLTFESLTKRGASDRHPDLIIADMHEALGRPPLLLLDNWPFVKPMIVIASHDVAEQVSQSSSQLKFSVPKAPTVERIADLFGYNSILLKQNEEWKAIRTRFNPGFASQHLTTNLLPTIIETTKPYLNILDTFARTKETFSFDLHTTDLTFDVIGAVAMEEDLKSQHIDQSLQGDMIRKFKEMISTYADDKLHLPWWRNPWMVMRRRRLGGLISQHLRRIVRRHFENTKGLGATSSRSILALSLKETNSFTPEVLEETCDQLKTFLFAGHDTTSTTISWAIYELSRTPHALKAVRDELDELFGTKSSASNEQTDIHERLLANGGHTLIHRMTYISAVLKEVLRLHPPAGSIRAPTMKGGFTVSTSQGKYNLNSDSFVYLNHHLIHRDKTVYGDDAEIFVPERWLQPSENSIPASAWRPFERGPRNCIGQELANIEARIVIAMLVRRYDFVKVGLGELELDDCGFPTLDQHTKQFKVKSELYPTIRITSKPIDTMMMKVKFAQEES
ncbi:putative cytochrome P450 monooxygenase [Nemania sp. FL0031]|nr:putative cytochrome P450 monooxygenase [Nemania sp. FL0031]